jgi:choice-of-anchor A domain-containing protein
MSRRQTLLTEIQLVVHSSVGYFGTVLGVDANVVNSAGSFNGQLLVNGYQQSTMELHQAPFTGCLPRDF